jgi:lipid-binding SYLF domain-containing protein
MTRLTTALLAAALILSSFQATAATKYERRMDNATVVLEQLLAIPEQGVPPSLLRDAHAVAVLPNVIKLGFGVGGRFGSGIMVVRRPDGRWSNPSFVNLGGGSLGLQIGAQSTDIVLVFRTARSVENLYRGKMTLGGDISVAAGPMGRSSSAATDITLRAEVLSYSRNRGLFAGLSVEGAVLGIDRDGNRSYYGPDNADARQILNEDTVPTTAAARRFQETLTAASPAGTAPQAEESRTALATPAPEPAENAPARTYGLDDAPPASGDVVF